MQHPLVAIVILNWNGKKYLEEFLPYLVLSTYAHYQIIVADNHSTDDSVAFLRRAYPQIRIIQLAENYGFARGIISPSNRLKPIIIYCSTPT